jgi:SAM-dependent methyltransferase
LKINFKLPIPDGYKSHPYWNGTKFIVDNHSFDILEYSENFSGWSDDLTALHEEIIGDNHPIDIASRAYAISKVRDFYLNQNSIIMEIGCSSGFLIKDLVHSFPDSVVIGADVVKEPLHRLAQLLPEVPLIRFDLLKCPLPNDCVDVVIMLNVLEHIQDDFEALKKSFNLLKPGGGLIIEVPAGSYLYDDYDAHLHHFRRYSAKDLNLKLQAAGFTIVRQSHLGIIIFPAFVLVKLLNKFFPSRSKISVVKKNASSTSSSVLFNWAMKFESKFLSSWRLPFGVRVLVAAQKPLDN